MPGNCEGIEHVRTSRGQKWSNAATDILESVHCAGGSINRVYRWGSRVCNSVCKSIRYHHIGGVPPTLPHATTIYFTARKNSTMMCYCAGFEFNSNILTVATALTIPNTTWALLNKEQCHTLAHLMLQRSLWFHTLS